MVDNWKGLLAGLQALKSFSGSSQEDIKTSRLKLKNVEEEIGELYKRETSLKSHLKRLMNIKKKMGTLKSSDPCLLLPEIY